MTTSDLKAAQTKAEIIEELDHVVVQQVYGDMDWVRSRAYWKYRLPELMEHTEELAEALTYALNQAALKDHPFDPARKRGK